MKPDKAYAHRCEVARQWAANVAFDELRQSAAPRVAKSYNIAEKDAHSIIVNAYKARNR